jgi:OOP family OmpA-OmpF porin
MRNRGITTRLPLPAICTLLVSLTAAACWAEETERLVKAVLPPAGNFRYLERADLRRYESGKFVGLEHREVRGVLQQGRGAAQARIAGTFYVLQALDHSGAHTAQEIEQEIPAAWDIQQDGTLAVDGDGAYPTLRGFPLVPVTAMAVGDHWSGAATRMVEPLYDGKFSRTRFLADYRYEGETTLGGKAVRVITATFAVRYRGGEDPAGDERLQSLSGTHEVSFQLSEPTGDISFMRDQVDEKYTFKDGTTVQLKGFILSWFTAVTPLNREETASRIARKLEESGTKDIVVVQKREGLSVSLNNIHFVAEQAAFLPDELPRLQALAAALKTIEGRSFRVVGHTAAVGTLQSQYELSVKRARAVVDFLAAQGMNAGRFLYEGRGGSEPVAPNDVEENMAKNRRVEIFVLED